MLYRGVIVLAVAYAFTAAGFETMQWAIVLCPIGASAFSADCSYLQHFQLIGMTAPAEAPASWLTFTCLPACTCGACTQSISAPFAPALCSSRS